MYRYTPQKDLLKRLKSERKRGYNSKMRGSYDWFMAREVTHGDYFMTVVFLRHWEHTNFYSPVKLRQVPVNGILFPVTMFDESVIE